MFAKPCHVLLGHSGILYFLAVCGGLIAGKALLVRIFLYHLSLVVTPTMTLDLVLVLSVSYCFYNKSPQFSGRKWHKFIILQFCSLKVQDEFHWGKTTLLAELCSFPGAPGDDPFPCLSQFLHNVWISWLMSPSCPLHGWWSLSHDVISLIFTLLPPSFPFKDPYNYFGPIIMSSC